MSQNVIDLLTTFLNGGFNVQPILADALEESGRQKDAEWLRKQDWVEDAIAILGHLIHPNVPTSKLSIEEYQWARKWILSPRLDQSAVEVVASNNAKTTLLLKVTNKLTDPCKEEWNHPYWRRDYCPKCKGRTWVLKEYKQ